MCQYQINSKCNVHLNARAEVMTLHEENRGKNPHDLALYKDFLNMTPKA